MKWTSWNKNFEFEIWINISIPSNIRFHICAGGSQNKQIQLIISIPQFQFFNKLSKPSQQVRKWVSSNIATMVRTRYGNQEYKPAPRVPGAVVGQSIILQKLFFQSFMSTFKTRW